ncbi:MAG: preprotein translocase subunit SecE [Clostridia bacterium]|nr:preprotein translocase subunit SecE [Clostridia bacterium]
MSTFDIVSLAILGALIIVGVIYCLKNKEKVGKFLRSLKSEFKKISWSSWRDVRKNTLVVIVVVVAVAVLIGVVDFLFSKGIISLDQLIG